LHSYDHAKNTRVQIRSFSVLETQDQGNLEEIACEGEIDSPSCERGGVQIFLAQYP
jgi:hypothetical protein